MTEDNAAPEIEQEVLFEFEDVVVEKAFLTLLGASALELDETQIIEQHDEVEIVLRGKCTQSRIVTRNRGDRDGGRQQTTVTRVVKIDELKGVKVKKQLASVKDV